MNEWQRNLKLRSITAALSKIENGIISTRSDFYLQLHANNIQLPITTKRLDDNKQYIQFILGNLQEKLEVLESLKKFETLSAKQNQLSRFIADLRFKILLKAVT